MQGHLACPEEFVEVNQEGCQRSWMYLTTLQFTSPPHRLNFAENLQVALTTKATFRFPFAWVNLKLWHSLGWKRLLLFFGRDG